MKHPFHSSRLAASLLVVAILTAYPLAVSAGDQGDGPALAQDVGADIADVFAFLDPLDATQVVLIATVHGFLVPGEVPNFAEFDPNIRYRFEIYNNHVNLDSPVLDPNSTSGQRAAYLAKVKPNLLIDVAFSKRAVGPDPQLNSTASGNIPTNLRRPKLQTATLSLQGFKDPAGGNLVNGGRYPSDPTQPLTVTPFNVGPTAAAFTVHTIPVTQSLQVKFFAGEVDDPFFFDSPSCSRFLDSIRNGSPSTASFSRARDTFAGYNVLAMAFRIPVALLQGSNGSKVGIDFLTQRQSVQRLTKKGVKGSGAFKTVDRMGNPWINSLLIPFDLRNAYNAASVKADVSRQFAGAITQTLSDFGLQTSPPEASAVTILNLAVAKGDLLQLDTAIANNGSGPSGFPFTGRRLQDDVVDGILTTLNHENSLGDNVNANEDPLGTSFPFLVPPHQPLYSTAPDDDTRN